MRVEQVTWSEQSGWQVPATIADARLLFVVGDRSALERPECVETVTERESLRNQTMTVTTYPER